MVEVGAFLLLDFFGLAFPPRSPSFCGDIITTLKPPPSVLIWVVFLALFRILLAAFFLAFALALSPSLLVGDSIDKF